MGKSIEKTPLLFIGPMFFGYHKEIGRLLETRGWEVYFKNEVPFESPTRYYLIEKISKKVRDYLWRTYERNIIGLIKSKGIKHTFIIRGQLLPESLIRTLKNEFNMIVFHYQWDSLNNNPNGLMISKYSDYNYTFDLIDSKAYPKFRYLPLFYNWNIDNNRICEFSRVYDMVFVASWSFDRFKKIKEMELFCKRNNLSYYVYLYMPFQTYIKLRLKGIEIPRKVIHFSSIDNNYYYALMSHAKIIFDSPSPKQVGASVRTFEALSLRKKLITTNAHLKNDVFYSSDSIAFWPLDDNAFKKFMESPFDEVSYNNIMSIEDWLKEIGL